MELKPPSYSRVPYRHQLLIVPYGIETENRELRKQLGMNF